MKLCFLKFVAYFDLNGHLEHLYILPSETLPVSKLPFEQIFFPSSNSVSVSVLKKIAQKIVKCRIQ